MRRRLLPPVCLLLALTGCGTEDSGAGSAPDRAELEARARAAQTVVEHVYVTEADGYTAATQSAGVLGADGFQVTYVHKRGGGRIALRVDRGTVDDANCRTVPPAASRCEKDGPGWYRVTGQAHEYARSENGLRVQVSADRGAVGRDVLRAAAERAHRADDRELDAILPRPADPMGLPTDGGDTGTPATPRTPSTPTAPVERGDLPEFGDQAPTDPPHVGG
ncbi:hypothetical protein [Streptomyces sp. G45]|uniref:hypothetical protein n=1 Tax=Streptomyces sp. G45 TaxID=3406627 RepID=UPI003C259AFC